MKKGVKKLMCIIAAMILAFTMIPTSANASTFVNWVDNTIITDYPPTNIIIANDGTSYVTNNNGGIMKYKPDGTLDTSFGTNGKILKTYRSISLCFDKDGNVLTGDVSQSADIVKIDPITGSYAPIINGIMVVGLETDTEGNIYVNTSNQLIKYSSTYQKLWEKTIGTDYSQIGLCLLKDGSIITTKEVEGDVLKYDSNGNLDTSFGTNGILNVSEKNIGFASYADGIYISSYGDGKILKISEDGKNVSTAFLGASPSILIRKNNYYFITNWKNNKIECFALPGSELGQQNCTLSPASIIDKSKEQVTINVNTDPKYQYDITAKVYNKATNELVQDVTSTTVALTSGNAAITLTPPEQGWTSGEYYVELTFASNTQSYSLTNTLKLDQTIVVHKNYIGSLTQNGVRVEGVGGTLFDIDAVLKVDNLFSGITTEQKTAYNNKIAVTSSNHSLIDLYNIKLLLNNEPYMPDGKMKVKIKLTEEQLKNYSDLMIVSVDENANVTDVASQFDGQYITFETTYLSEFGITGVLNKTTETSSVAESSPVTENSSVAVTTDTPATGDNNNIIILGLTLIGSCCSIMLLYKNKKRKWNID